MRKTPDGATEGDHQASAARQWAMLGSKSGTALADDPEFPDLIFHVWKTFWEILAGAPLNGMAPAVISWADMCAWCEMTGDVLEPWEARLIVRLSALRAQIVSESMTKKTI